MANEGTGRGGNGERGELKGTIAGQSFSIITKDIVTVLLIVCGLAGGVVAWYQLDKRVDTTWKYVDSRLTTMEQQHSKFYEMLQGNRELTREEADRLLKQLAVVNWNCVHDPTQQLPLGLNGPPTQPPRP